MSCAAALRHCILCVLCMHWLVCGAMHMCGSATCKWPYPGIVLGCG